MKKYAFFTICAISLLIFGGCVAVDSKVIELCDGYSLQGNKAFYNKKEMVGADAKTFECLGDYYYAKDKNNAYLRGEVIPESHGQSFKKINMDYWMDKNNVYFGSNSKKIQMADLQTFEVLSYPISKDKNNVYYGDKIMKVRGGEIDALSFEVLNAQFLKDKNYIYSSVGIENAEYHIEVLKNADVNTFEILDDTFPFSYAKDKNYVYRRYGGDPTDWDVESFEILCKEIYAYGSYDLYYWIKDKNGLYHSDIDLSDGQKDLATLQLFKRRRTNANNSSSYSISCYFKDKNHIYLGEKKLESIDPETFEIIDGEDLGDNIFRWFYSKDKENIYFHPINSHPMGLNDEPTRLEGVDLKSFFVLRDFYAKDKEKIYFEGVKMKNVDYDSFEIVEGNEEYDAEDKNYKYKNGKIVN